MQWKDLKGLFLEMELIAVLGIVSKCPVEVVSHTCRGGERKTRQTKGVGSRDRSG